MQVLPGSQPLTFHFELLPIYSSTYKGYTAKIEFDPDDNILVGHIIGIRDTVGFHGETVSELKDAFYEAGKYQCKLR